MSAPVFALHHIGYLTADLAASAEQLARRFGYRIESPVIHDPQQTARVQFLRLPHADAWLELITPDGETSKLTRAVQTEGDKLHHLCYEADDLQAACDSLRADGLLLISPPTPAVAFPGRQIAWLIDRRKMLVELLQAGEGALSLSGLSRTVKHQAE